MKKVIKLPVIQPKKHITTKTIKNNPSFLTNRTYRLIN